MQSFGGLLGLAPVALKALLGVSAAAQSGVGLFSGVSFGWGDDALLCIVMNLILDTKETVSPRV